MERPRHGLRQGISLKLLDEGKKIDIAPFRESIAKKPGSDAKPIELLQYGLGALLLAMHDDPAGLAALKSLAGLDHAQINPVLQQVLNAGLTLEFAPVGPLAMSAAKNQDATTRFKMMALQTALRLKAEGAGDLWLKTFEAEKNSVLRLRLAMVVLDASHESPTKLFDTLTKDSGETIRLIGEAARAIQQKKPNLVAVFTPLLAAGTPSPIRWLSGAAKRVAPEQAVDLHELVIRSYARGQKANRGQRIGTAMSAVREMIRHDPSEATKRLPKLMNEPFDKQEDEALRRRVILIGLSQPPRTPVPELIKSIKPSKLGDFTIDTMRLLLRLRYGLPLTEKEWAEVSDVVQGVGQTKLELRIQFAWYYLKHLGKAEQAIAAVFK